LGHATLSYGVLIKPRPRVVPRVGALTCQQINTFGKDIQKFDRVAQFAHCQYRALKRDGVRPCRVWGTS